MKTELKQIKRFLDENQVDVFRSEDLYLNFRNLKKEAFNYILRKLIDLEYSKIETGLYCRNTFRNEYVIGNYLTNDAVIAYWSALNIHGLTEQFPNKVYVQTSKKKKNKEIFGVAYQFIKVRQNKLTGIIKTGMGSYQFRITDVEKTIADCFDLVQYSGGFMELIRAFNRTKLNSKKMIEYTIANANSAASKRMGFLAELLEKKHLKPFIDFAKEQKSKHIDLFNPQGYDEGLNLQGWNLKLNMEKDEIISIANSIY